MAYITPFFVLLQGFSEVLPRFLYQMVTLNMFRMHSGKKGLLGENNPNCDCSFYNQMPLTDQILLVHLFMSHYLI